MKKKINKRKTVEGTFGNLQLVEDFLPKPEDLILKKGKKVKVTLELSSRSVDFFKKTAKAHGTAYQAMIRNLLDYYVSHQ